MKTETTERDWVEEVGAPAYAVIAEMVAALQCDRERLEELRDERDDYEVGSNQWLIQCPDDATELVELEASAGDCISEDDARETIQEDPLSLRIFGERTNDGWEADRYELLLTTGGPAVRIVGDISSHGEASSARLEVQDWGKPWTEYFPADHDVLMAYVGCHYFGCE